MFRPFSIFAVCWLAGCSGRAEPDAEQIGILLSHNSDLRNVRLQLGQRFRVFDASTSCSNLVIQFRGKAVDAAGLDYDLIVDVTRSEVCWSATQTPILKSEAQEILNKFDFKNVVIDKCDDGQFEGSGIYTDGFAYALHGALVPGYTFKPLLRIEATGARGKFQCWETLDREDRSLRGNFGL